MNLSLVLIVVGLLLGFVLLGDVRTPAGQATAVDVSVIIPARNEEASLPNLLRSLSQQSFQPVEVIVVDDGSTDGTRGIVGEFGADLVIAPPLPGGWVGKSWACHLGSLQARGELLVFLDADVVVAPDGLSRVVASWQRDAGGGLLSVQPFHIAPHAYEQLSAYPNLMAMMACGAFVPMHPSVSPVAFGPCLVTSVSAYRQVGGHQAVAAEVIEDVHLARVYGAAGLPVRALGGGSALSFRMYPSGLRQLIDGWTKNLAGGPRLVAIAPLVAAMAWILASIAVASDLIQALAAFVFTGRVAVGPIVLGVAAAAQVSILLRRLGAFRWWAGLAFPALAAGFVALFVRSMIHRTFRRSVSWHDRRVVVRDK